MGYKAGGKCRVIKSGHGLVKGDIYSVKHNGAYFVTEQGFILETHERFWPWQFFEPYEEFEIKCEEDYYKWLANR